MKMGTGDKKWKGVWSRALLHWECRWASKRWEVVHSRRLCTLMDIAWDLGNP